ncbi:hypothetical protein TWF718_003733 [Orbilia javanica]|uniref:Uncharacterized protein n=1 Tax=Orbilia javanica TaxID=47235 RepID=A0AAN8RKG7_9PEZI
MRVTGVIAILSGALSLPLPIVRTSIMDTSPLTQPYQPPDPHGGGTGSTIGLTGPSKDGTAPLPPDGMYGLPYIEQPKPMAHANPMLLNPNVVVSVPTTTYALPQIAVGTAIAE